VHSDYNPVVITVRIKPKEDNQSGRKTSQGYRKVKRLHNCHCKYDSDRALVSQAEHESSVYARWKTLKQAVFTTAATTLGHTKRIRNRKLWIKAEMIDKITQRRKWK